MLHRLNILLVEDNRAVGRAIAKALEAQGHRVTLVHDCAGARAVTEPHQLGILDISLEDGDGIELCRRLLDERRVEAALFFSGSIDDLLVERAERVARVVAKEASFAELCAAIEAVRSDASLDRT
jgi:DNA-binding response OmpR family regulator